jgi:hypothetical protein
MALKLKLPKLRLPSFGYGRGVLPKKQWVKGIDNYTLAGGGIVATLIAIYYAQMQGWIRLPFLGGILSEEQEDTADTGGTPTGHQINFAVSPVVAQEGSAVLISGKIVDSNGVAFNAPHLYYYVYQELEGSIIKLVSSGDVGSNTSEFRREVSLAGLRPGDYKMRVSEEILPSSGQVQAGSTDIAGQAPPNLSNIVTPNEFGNITLS